MGMWNRRVHDPYLRLEGPGGNGYETDEEHMIDIHEAFANPPPIFGRFLQSDILRNVRERTAIISSWYERTAIRLRYWSTFLATS